MTTPISQLTSRSLSLAALIPLLLALLPSAARADIIEPGSLLIYPECDTRAGVTTVLTITNVSRDLVDGEVQVHFKYIGAWDTQGNDLECRQTDVFNILTPMDTLTLIANAHNPMLEQGYVYAFAEDPDTGRPLRHNHLIGSLLVVDGMSAFEYSVNPFSFEALAESSSTDVDGDRQLDLDGQEYSRAPGEIIIPRFLGQSAIYESELILISLTGGSKYSTLVGLEIANDNEEIFAGEYLFDCWTKQPLLAISGVFDQGFLEMTNHDHGEILGAPQIESGWLRIDGKATIAGSFSQRDPAILAVLVERIGTRGVADQPFTIGNQSNAYLPSWW